MLSSRSSDMLDERGNGLVLVLVRAVALPILDGNLGFLPLEDIDDMDLAGDPFSGLVGDFFDGDGGLLFGLDGDDLLGDDLLGDDLLGDDLLDDCLLGDALPGDDLVGDDGLLKDPDSFLCTDGSDTIFPNCDTDVDTDVGSDTIFPNCDADTVTSISPNYFIQIQFTQ